MNAEWPNWNVIVRIINCTALLAIVFIIGIICNQFCALLIFHATPEMFSWQFGNSQYSFPPENEIPFEGE